MNKALIFASGLILGAVGGYFVAKKVYVKAKEEEIASIEAAFKSKTEEAPETVTEEKKDISQSRSPLTEKEHTFPKTDYTTYSKQVSNYSSDDDVVSAMDQAVAADRRGHGFIDPTREFVGRVVTRDEFKENEEGHSQEFLTYYEGDKTLATMQNDIFEEIEYLPVDFDKHFDDNLIDKRYDADVVYVRNDDLELDYEITRDERAFSDVVQHLE